ncbi:UNVERIFIED_CONTAM: hypothetical protein NCL1_21728 [Trichonephila clavipes]
MWVRPQFSLHSLADKVVFLRGLRVRLANQSSRLVRNSNRQKLEPIYNAALRLALGLPRNTPLDLLRVESMNGSFVSKSIPHILPKFSTI